MNLITTEKNQMIKPDLDKLRQTIRSIESQLVYSITNCQKALNDLTSVEYLNTIERSNYLNDTNEIKDLIQDFRLDKFSPMNQNIESLKEFIDTLEKYDSDFINMRLNK